MRQRHSWEITDEFWARAELLIPPSPRNPAKEYQRGPGGGRPPVGGGGGSFLDEPVPQDTGPV
jgi:hypothetical protein